MSPGYPTGSQRLTTKLHHLTNLFESAHLAAIVQPMPQPHHLGLVLGQSAAQRGGVMRGEIGLVLLAACTSYAWYWQVARPFQQKSSKQQHWHSSQ
jgi:hypothetical protein